MGRIKKTAAGVEADVESIYKIINPKSITNPWHTHCNYPFEKYLYCLILIQLLKIENTHKNTNNQNNQKGDKI